jgi:hypothetical protein
VNDLPGASRRAAIKAQADELGKHVFERLMEIVDDDGNNVATVTKTPYVRKRDDESTAPTHRNP